MGNASSRIWGHYGCPTSDRSYLYSVKDNEPDQATRQTHPGKKLSFHEGHLQDDQSPNHSFAHQDETSNFEQTVHTQRNCTNGMIFGPHTHTGPIVSGNYYMLRPIITTLYPLPPPPKEDLTKIWASLKTRLQLSYEKLQIPKIPWLDWEQKFSEYYVDLSVQTKTDEQMRDIHLHDIFRSNDGKKQTRILVQGPAGYGKTTLASKMCYDHANGEEYILQFEVVILLRLRDFENTLDDLITNTLDLKDYKEENVLEAIKENEHKVLFFLDGFDELPLHKHEDVVSLLDGNRLPNATVITTSRMATVENGSSCTNLMNHVQSRIAIKGITGSNKTAFLKTYLKHSWEKSKHTIKLVEDRFASLFQEDLFNCPLFLLLLVILVEEEDISTLRTKTQLYKKLFNFILRRMFAKRGESNHKYDFFCYDKDNPPAYVKMLIEFGTLAMKALKQHQYSFTVEELRSCVSNNDILELGILTQNDSKPGLKRKSWFEPIHLSFLEFSVAYKLSICLIPTSELDCFFVARDILDFLYINTDSLTLPFLFGLCGQQLATVCECLGKGPEAGKWLAKLTYFDDIMELEAESQLKLSDLVEALLPLVPEDFSLLYLDRTRILLRETLIHAVHKKQLRSHAIENICYISELNVDRLSDQPIKLIPRILWNVEDPRMIPSKITSRQVMASANESDVISRNAKPTVIRNWQIEEAEMRRSWYEIVTHQNLSIEQKERPFKFEFTISKDTLDEQLKWLSNWMVIEELLEDKPIHKIKYECSDFNIADTLNKITELIWNDKVVSIKIDYKSSMPPENWKKFVYYANQSKVLLDITINDKQREPLVVDVIGDRSKKWRSIDFNNVLPSNGLSPMSEQPAWDLQKVVEVLPSTCFQYLRVRTHPLSYDQIYVFKENNDFPVMENLCELSVTFEDDSNLLEKAWNWQYLVNLQVLAIGFSWGFPLDEIQKKYVASSLVSMLSCCHPLMRLEFWRGCSDEFVSKFLQLYREKKWSGGRRRSSNKSSPQMDTLLLSHSMADFVKLSDSTVELLNEFLLQGFLRELWVSVGNDVPGYRRYGYANAEFVKLFPVSGGFFCEVRNRLDTEAHGIHDGTSSHDAAYYMTITVQEEG